MPTALLILNKPVTLPKIAHYLLQQSESTVSKQTKYQTEFLKVLKLNPATTIRTVAVMVKTKPLHQKRKRSSEKYDFTSYLFSFSMANVDICLLVFLCNAILF